MTANEQAEQISVILFNESFGITEDWKHMVQTPQSRLDRKSIKTSDLESLTQTSVTTKFLNQYQYPPTIFIDTYYSKLNINLISSLSTNEPSSQYLPQLISETIDEVINSQSEVSMIVKIPKNHNQDNITPSDSQNKAPKNQIQTLTNKSLRNSKNPERKSKLNRKEYAHTTYHSLESPTHVNDKYDSQYSTSSPIDDVTQDRRDTNIQKQQHASTLHNVKSNLTFGDELINKDNQTSRIVFNNVGGLELLPHSLTLKLLGDSSRKHYINILYMV